jgi:hypothetical protein
MRGMLRMRCCRLEIMMVWIEEVCGKLAICRWSIDSRHAFADQQRPSDHVEFKDENIRQLFYFSYN